MRRISDTPSRRAPDSGLAPALEELADAAAGPDPAGALDPGALDPGALDPGALDPGALDPGALDLDAMPPGVALPPPARHVFANRTLNLRGIKAIGYDMDYTLVHYRTEAWERRAYEHVQRTLSSEGWPVGDLTFDPDFAMLGLILDLERGNLVKANRFGYVKKAFHGTDPLPYDQLRRAYTRVVVDLSEPRWVFLNTLFSLSEAMLFAQLVQLRDAGVVPEHVTYGAIYRLVRSSLDRIHAEGRLKQEILAEPDEFIDLDHDLPLTLLDQRAAGKKLLLITNSEWPYTRAVMSHVFDRFLPGDQTWRDLFDLVVCSARKPSFFEHTSPAFEVIDDEGLLRPVVGDLELGKAYVGGNAALVEKTLGLSGDDLLYVGDHVFADVNVSKNLLRWRTALVVRELERELEALEAFKPAQARLTELMERKTRLEHAYTDVRVRILRIDQGYGPRDPGEARAAGGEGADIAGLRDEQHRLREAIVALDEGISRLARRADELQNRNWGLLMRAGNDKSHLARQIERYADVYTTRVSNFLHWTPYAYLRSPRGSLPHDSGRAGGVQR